MQFYIVDAFTAQVFGGNQAGVVLLDSTAAFPPETWMQQVAAELKHSETAFVKRISADTFHIRYFTPKGEVDLCGHATISAFTVLREEASLPCGRYQARTAAGTLPITVESGCVWMGMAAGKLLHTFTNEESEPLYAAYGLNLSDRPPALQPCLVSTGLPDILLPVDRADTLNRAVQNREQVMELSRKYHCIGVHLYYPEFSSDVTARCRNFAPLYGIDEESATGTSNGALTFYLRHCGLLPNDQAYTFLQGESMGKPSVISSRIDRQGNLSVGGTAVISAWGQMKA